MSDEKKAPKPNSETRARMLNKLQALLETVPESERAQVMMLMGEIENLDEDNLEFIRGLLEEPFSIPSTPGCKETNLIYSFKFEKNPDTIFNDQLLRKTPYLDNLIPKESAPRDCFSRTEEVLMLDFQARLMESPEMEAFLEKYKKNPPQWVADLLSFTAAPPSAPDDDEKKPK